MKEPIETPQDKIHKYMISGSDGDKSALASEIGMYPYGNK